MNFLAKLKETAFSVIPIAIIILLLGIFVVPMGKSNIVEFLLGTVFVITGLSIFLLGVDLSILPVGEKTGAVITSKRNLPLLLGVAFIVGFVITMSEPDVQLLAIQVTDVSPGLNKLLLVLAISIGIGLFTAFGLLRTVFNLKLNVIFIISYAAVFLMFFFGNKNLQNVAFDAGGATTGPMTVPFIMALGIGVAAVQENRKSDSENSSFGLTGIASIGPVCAVLLYGMLHQAFSGESAQSQITESSAQENFSSIWQRIPSTLIEVTYSLVPLLILIIIFQIIFLKMPPVQFFRVILGLLYSFIGLTLYLTGAKHGFIEAGTFIGSSLANKMQTSAQIWKFALYGISIILGALTVLAEPAVQVLTGQVESLSNGTIKKNVMLVALSGGIALALLLSMIRVLNGLPLWYFIVPGYALSLLLSLFCPPLFVAIAFDSGGVASGPMTSTFILAFMLGTSSVCGGNPLTDGFGVIALVAMMPLLTIQILGIIFKLKQNKAGGEK